MDHGGIYLLRRVGALALVSIALLGGCAEEVPPTPHSQA